MRRLTSHLLLLVCLLPTVGFADEGKEQVFIVHGSSDGYRYQEPISSYPAGEYFALACNASLCALKKTAVLVREATVDVYSSGPMPGHIVSVNQPAESLFLVRGLPGLSEGPVTTWYFNERFQEAPFPESRPHVKRQFTKSIPIDGQEAKFSGAWIKARQPDCFGSACESKALAWKFGFGTIERTLATLMVDAVVGEEGMLGADDFLVWVGDLDGDGQPDIVVRPQARPDYLELALFLSSQLRVGQPWKPAAVFHYWDPLNPGC